MYTVRNTLDGHTWKRQIFTPPPFFPFLREAQVILDGEVMGCERFGKKVVVPN